MYVELTFKYLYFTIREPDAPDYTLWQWDADALYYGNWHNKSHRWKRGYINMGGIIT